MVAGVASLIALVQMFYPIAIGSKSGIDWFMAMMYPLIIYFWIALGKGINEPLEPSLFVHLGLFGAITFGTELSRLFRDRIVWSGIEILFDSLPSMSARTVAGTAAKAVAGTVFGFFLLLPVIGWFVIGLLTVLFVKYLAMAVATAIALTLTVAEAGVWALAGAGYLVMVCAGMGIGIWHSKKIDNKIIKLSASDAYLVRSPIGLKRTIYGNIGINDNQPNLCRLI